MPSAQNRPFHHGRLRQSLLEAALVAPDIEGLSLRQLAAGLGVTAASVYRHFASREELLFEVARLGFARLTQRFESAFPLALAPAGAEEARWRLHRLAEAYLQFADDEPALWRLMFGAQAEGYRQWSSARMRGSRTASIAGSVCRTALPAPPR